MAEVVMALKAVMMVVVVVIMAVMEVIKSAEAANAGRDPQLKLLDPEPCREHGSTSGER